MPVLDELRDRGHEVAIRTLASEVEAMWERGFDAAPIAAEIERQRMGDWRARSLAGRSARATRTFAHRAVCEPPDLRRAIGQERPDALLIDVIAWGALAAAEEWGGRWACVCPFPLPLSGAGLPPAGLGLRPAQGPLGRARDGLLRSPARFGFDRLVLPWLNRGRGDCGLAPLRHADELFMRPPLLLYMTAEPFEYARREWPPNLVMVGPCAWEPSSGELPPALAEIEQPLILVTTSTDFQDDGRLVVAAIEALADGPFHLVATLPSAKLPDVSMPGNATILGFTPHGPILDRAACAVTHGGMGATQKALGRGVPVCAVPFGRDQFDVARRVEVAGAGSRLSSRRLRPDRLRAKVEQALGCKAGAERVAEGFAAAGGAKAAADAVERRLLGVAAEPA